MRLPRVRVIVWRVRGAGVVFALPAGSAGLPLLALRAPPVPVQGGGFGDSGGGDAVDEGASAEYKPVRLPLSAKAARTWVALHEMMIKPPPDGAPFGAVFAALKGV